MSTTNWSSQAGMGDGDSGDVTSGSTTIDTNWTQSSGMTDVSDAEEANIVELVERAETAATNAETAETNAETAETNAETAETGAETAKTGAETAKTAAEAAQTASEAAQTAAETAESNAETAYANTLAIYGDTTDVQDAVDSASTSATNAATSATSASTSATSASTSASAAATSATAAATSATSSASSASTSNTSALAAQTAEANAETAEANAITARLAAESAESNAEGSATQAANSATSASSSASQALSSKNAAAASESAAATSAYNAGVSESNASTSEDNAATSESNSASSATAAASSASSAASSATDAETAQTAAESAQVSAEAVYDSFDDRYLGSKSSDPTLDNDGDALLTGALYFNSTENEMRVYTGSAWEPVQELSGDQTVNSLTSNNDVVVKGNLEVQGTTITVDSATAQTIDLGDNDKIRLGDSDDLQIYHSGSNSVITDVGQGSLYIGGDNNVIIASGNLNTTKARFTLTDVELYYEGEQKFATTSSGVDITGTVVADSLTVEDSGTIELEGALSKLLFTRIDTTTIGGNPLGSIEFAHQDADDAGTAAKIIGEGDGSTGQGRLVFYTGTPSNLKKNMLLNSGGDVFFYENTGTTAKLTWDASAEELQFKDGVAAEFGDGSDFQIEHNGTNTKITNNTGTLKIVQNVNDGDVEISSDDGSGATALYFVADGSTGEVKLFHYGSQKLATKSTGVDVTGTVTADGFLGGTNVLRINSLEGSRGSIQISAPHLLTREVTYGNNFYLASDGTYTQDSAVIGGGLLQMTAPNADFGEFLFKSKQDPDSGGAVRDRLKIANTGDISFYDDAGTSQDLYWDASTSRLGIGTTSPSYQLHVKAPSTSDSITTFEGGSVTTNGQTTSSTLRLQTWGQASDGGTRYARYSWIAEPDSSWGSANLKLGYYYDGNARPDVLKVNHSGDVIFYAQDGTTEAFYWDKSTSRLGLGTTSPSQHFEVSGSGQQWVRVVSTDASGGGLKLRSGGSFDMNIQDDVGNLKFSRGSTEQMRLDSSGNVGIATTSPSSTLTVNGTITETSNSVDYNVVSQYDIGTDPNEVPINALLGSMAYQDVEGVNVDLLTVNDNLGIGTASPSTTLHVKHNGGGLRLQGESSDLYGAYLDFAKEAGTRRGLIGYTGSGTSMAIQNDESGDIRFINNGSEAARIDSSGNLLVGTTNVLPGFGNTAEGISLRGGSHVLISRSTTSGNSALYVNKNTSDGALVNFSKDGNTVGSIGTVFSDLCIGTGDTGIRFWDAGPGIFPVDPSNTFANKDNAVDLGLSSVRWKNLYLSGGVYLGGTGSANLLDDYEEGTWTPVFTPTTGSFTTMTMDVVTATYTKIGDTVTITAYIRTDDVDTTGGSGLLRITGLPFASSGYHAIAVSYSSGWSTNPKGVYTESGQTYAIVTYETSSTGDLNGAPTPVLATGTTANANRIILSGVYKTSS